ncbi:hypothetical protein [Saccharopolyspora rosea]|uniref:Uncharacterized protein n=1 Tax=Saccharopolyspora rosea TaxID=524884 RepID=A0ABW3FL73_9PSEU|nr:hypothetical protein [Saccharopolyspora rosea]
MNAVVVLLPLAMIVGAGIGALVTFLVMRKKPGQQAAAPQLGYPPQGYPQQYPPHPYPPQQGGYPQQGPYPPQ